MLSRFARIERAIQREVMEEHREKALEIAGLLIATENYTHVAFALMTAILSVVLSFSVGWLGGIGVLLGGGFITSLFYVRHYRFIQRLHRFNDDRDTGWLVRQVEWIVFHHSW